MSDPLAGLFSPSFFFPGKGAAGGNNELRQRLAMAMLAQKRAYPKTFGEGLGAIGDALGDRGQMQQMLDFDKAQRDYAGGFTGTPPGVLPPAPATPPPATGPTSAPRSSVSSYAPAGPSPPPVVPGATPVGGDAEPEIAPPPPLTTTPPAGQAGMLSPGLPGLQPPTAVAANRDQLAATVMSGKRMMPPPPPRTFDAANNAVQTDATQENLIDAGAGMRRPGDGRVQDALVRAYPGNPAMQAYGSSLVSGEWRGPGDVSSTGARGPYQFVPGTARQYGLTNPEDPNQATDAFKRFTADNAALFEKRFGRPPTMAELAVLHQQGAGTGSNMIAGTGNASPRNLALNNINPAAGPQQAVDRIKSYYGMPERPVDARTAVAAAATPPTMAFSGEPTPDGTNVLSFTPPNAQQAPNIPPAPPPQRMAQAPAATASDMPPPGYVPPAPPPTAAPTPTPMSQREVQLTRAIAAQQGNPYVAQSPAAQELAQLQQSRMLKDEQAKKLYEVQLARESEMLKLREQAKMDAPKREQDYRKGQRPELVKQPGSQYVWDEKAQMYRKPAVEKADPNAPPDVEMNSEQAKAVKFHGWTSLAEQQLQGKEKLLTEGLVQEMVGKIPFFGNKAQQAEYKQARDAAERFVQGFLRDISGAAISPAELDKHMKTFLPRYGDSDKVANDKRVARQQIIDGLYAEAGPGREIIDYTKNRRQQERAIDETPIGREMSGVEKTPGVRRYSKSRPGVYRVYTPGVGWEEHHE